MEVMTIRQVLELAKGIDTARPKDSNYFSWHAWRMRMVKRAMLLLGARIAARGYELYIAETYVIVNIDGYKGYIQYDQLAHTYSDVYTHYLDYNPDTMVVTDHWVEVYKAMEAYVYRTHKSFDRATNWMRTNNDYIHIKKIEK